MQKMAFIINGRGGCGKDTFCGFAAERYRVRNISSITPIKEIARFAGWNGEKDTAARAMLAELKAVFIKYNDLPAKYVLEQYDEFMAGDEELMFIHVREIEEIARLVTMMNGGCRTLLIRRPDARAWGNAADDGVEDYDYDYYYENDKPLDEMRGDVWGFLLKILNAGE